MPGHTTKERSKKKSKKTASKKRVAAGVGRKQPPMKGKKRAKTTIA